MAGLFDDFEPPPTSGPYTGTPAWQRARDEAMAAVSDKAEDAAPGFADRAGEFVLDYLSRHGPTAGERITDACKAAGIVAHDDRAFGPVYMKLVRAGLIRKAGFATRYKGHGTAGAHIWELAADGDTVPVRHGQP